MTDAAASGPVTIRQVADLAGVSRQTVSNVLNFPDRVDPATTVRVRDAIRTSGYRPNRNARNLATKQAGLVGYCLGGTGGRSAFMDDFLHALSASVEESGRHVLLFTASDGAGGMDVYADLVAQRAVDAFILTDVVNDDPRHPWLAERGIPFASFGRTWHVGGQSGPWVDVDGAGACGLLVDGLWALGHQRIAFLECQHATGATLDRRSGWRTACRRLGLPDDDTPVAHSLRDDVASGADATAALLDSARPPTAIVAANDLLAVGALREVEVRGLRPGVDIAVTGFDDSMLASVARPGLTTVRQPLTEIAETLVRQIRTPGADHAVLLPGQVVSRASAPVRTPHPELRPVGPV